MTAKEIPGAIRDWITLAKLFVAVVGGGLSVAAGGSWWLATLQADVRANTTRVEKLATGVEQMQRDLAFLRGRLDKDRVAVGR